MLRSGFAKESFLFIQMFGCSGTSMHVLKPKGRGLNAPAFAVSAWRVPSKLQPGISTASAGLLRAGASLFDLIPPLNPLPRRALAGRVPQPRAALSCHPQTRKRQANSSLSRSSSARGRKESPPRTARNPNWSPATPSATSATAPSPRMTSRAAGWGKSARACRQPLHTQPSLPLPPMAANSNSPSAERQQFVLCLLWSVCLSPSSECDTCCFRPQNLTA